MWPTNPSLFFKFFFLNHSHGADLALSLSSTADKSGQKANCVSSLYPSCFGCLGRIQLNDVRAIEWLLLCYCSCVAPCGPLASASFLRNCEQRHVVVPAKRVCVRMDVSGHPDSCELWQRPKICGIYFLKYIVLCKRSSWTYFLSFFSSNSDHFHAPSILSPHKFCFSSNLW